MSNLRVSLVLLVVSAAFVIGPGSYDPLSALQARAEDQTTASINLLAQKNPQKAGADASTDTSKDAAYWYDRGVLLSVYGNPKAAIEAFKKAIALAPGNSDAHFQLGVEYGTTGQYSQALVEIGKALEINPDKAAFYYGRGWVLLLSGNKDQAIQDFEVAAQKGHPDAIDYLRRQESDQN